MNIDNLYNRISKEETEAIVAVADMMFGNIYQSQSDFNFYTIEKFTGYVLRLDRFDGKWLKQKGLSFSWVMSQKYKKVLEEVSK